MIKPYDLDALRQGALVAERPAGTAAPGLSRTRPRPCWRRAFRPMYWATLLHRRREMLLESKGPCSIVKDVTPAWRSAFETTPACVEGAVRKAIRRAWEQNGGQFPALPGLGDTGAAPPANGRFLMALRACIASVGRGEGPWIVWRS